MDKKLREVAEKIINAKVSLYQQQKQGEEMFEEISFEPVDIVPVTQVPEEEEND